MNIHIKDSYKVPKRLFDSYLDSFKEHEIMKHRSRFSLKLEWAAHNLLYMLHVQRERTKDVDLDYPQKWYYKISYFVLGLIGSIIVK